MSTELLALIVNYNAWGECRAAVESLLASPPHTAGGRPLALELAVVDNASPIKDAAEERALERLLAGRGRLVSAPSNLGYAGGCNLGCAGSDAPWLLVSNPDVVYQPGCLDALLRAAERDPGVAAAAPLGFLDDDLTVFLPVGFLPTPLDSLRLALATCGEAQARRFARGRASRALRLWSRDADRELVMPSGHALLLRRAPGDAPPFDERYALYFEDADLAQRLRRGGRRMVQVHDARVVHRHDRSGRSDPAEKERRLAESRPRYFQRWYGSAGAALDAAVRRRLAGPAAQRAARRLTEAWPAAPLREGRPWLPLARPCARFLVLLAADPWMTYPGGVFDSGDAWRPAPAVLRALGGGEAFVRVLDLGSEALPEVARYRVQGSADG